MITANQITIVRLLLIPVFVVLGMYYGGSVQRHTPDEPLRWAAILVFVVAGASDGLDGYVARHYHQTSKLGAILDAIADKALLLAALVTLTFSDWGYRLPLWFPVLVVGRDLIVVAGSLALQYLNGVVHVRPRWTGKIATFFTICAIVWVMLQFHFIDPLVPVAIAGVFTFLSWIGYMSDGIRQLRHTYQVESMDDPLAALSPLEQPKP